MESANSFRNKLKTHVPDLSVALPAFETSHLQLPPQTFIKSLSESPKCLVHVKTNEREIIYFKKIPI